MNNKQPTNCPNCGAPLKDGKCEYCCTEVKDGNQQFIDYLEMEKIRLEMEMNRIMGDINCARQTSFFMSILK